MINLESPVIRLFQKSCIGITEMLPEGVIISVGIISFITKHAFEEKLIFVFLAGKYKLPVLICLADYAFQSDLFFCQGRSKSIFYLPLN